LSEHRRPLAERLLFLREFITSPRHLGSITPSSRYLVRTLIGLAGVTAAHEAVELGPGTGPFTVGLLHAMPAGSRLLCIERDPALAEHLRARLTDPRLTVVTGDAADLGRYLEEQGMGAQVPLIVSGLPFTSLPEAVRSRILDAITSSLRPDGDFLLYQYSPAMRARLRRHFQSVETVWELRNLPPALCFRCRLPQDAP
jgi:phospholipid N-methyltransferase